MSVLGWTGNENDLIPCEAFTVSSQYQLLAFYRVASSENEYAPPLESPGQPPRNHRIVFRRNAFFNENARLSF